jgi:hypothetical protein
MQNLNLKGIWIPIEILTDKRLSEKEKTSSLLRYVSESDKEEN